MDPLLIVSLSAPAVMAGALARRPVKRWYRKVRRRRGGVYLWRVRHHLKPWRRVNGYVGESVSFYLRGRDHMGKGRFDQEAQSWSDLDPVMHKIISLPWWLCWKWVMRPLETLVMLCTWPVYNDAKNRWNPRRITKSKARIQRAQRDQGALAYRVRVTTGRAVRIAFQVAGVALTLAATYGWIVTR